MPSPPPSPSRDSRLGDAASTGSRWLIATAAPAIIVPALLAYNVPPSATFLNQAAALIGWGGFAVVLVSSSKATNTPLAGQPSVDAATADRGWPGGGRGPDALLVALLLLAMSAAASALLTGLPWSLALSTIGTVAAALVVTAAAAVAARRGNTAAAFQAFCIALALAGGLSTVVAIVQVFVPSWVDGNLIAAASVPGRASGNLRQPNHLSSLLLWSVIAVLWLGDAGRVHRWLVGALWAAFVFALLLSGSRTGTIGIVILGLWGALDRRLSRHTRALLLLSPLLYALCWFGLTAWANTGHAALVDQRRFSGEGDISASRFGIWANTLALIARHPWWGVGFGDFNFAWSLTPFPGRPVAFFDHTHNLPLQFAVELGLPLAALVLALLLFALWRAFAAGHRAADPARAALLRAAFMMVLMIALHSQLEYPLWYAYFLLPTAFAFGLCLGADAAATPSGPSVAAASPPPAAPSSERPDTIRARASRPLALAALLLIAGGVSSIVDYWRVVAIFQPGADADPLAARIARGQRSWFFSHHADYAAATTESADAIPAVDRLAPFAGATHYLLDTRLMIAWANALHAAGDIERARHLAQRLREFRNADSADYFEPCDDASDAALAAGAAAAGSTASAGEPPLPYQCTPPTRLFDYRDFENPAAALRQRSRASSR